MTFVSQAAIDGYLAQRLGVAKKLLPVRNTRGGISKKSMMLNDATPNIEVDPETYEVRADGELLDLRARQGAAHGAAVFPVLGAPPARGLPLPRASPTLRSRPPT